MVFLRSIHSGAESIRSSFCGPTDLEDGKFALFIDEPTGGPVVIRVVGDIDRSAVPIFGECLSEAIVCGRSVVVDLMETESVDPAINSILAVVASRLARHRCRATVACTDRLRWQLGDAVFGVDFYDTVADAVGSTMKTRAQTDGASGSGLAARTA